MGSKKKRRGLFRVLLALGSVASFVKFQCFSAAYTRLKQTNERDLTSALRLTGASNCRITQSSWHLMVVWPHGLNSLDDILQQLREQLPEVTIPYRKYFRLSNMSQFIEKLYDADVHRVGIRHIAKKTQYLLKLQDPRVLVLILLDEKPNYTQYGKGKWKVRANSNMVDFKWLIRQKLNPKLDSNSKRDARGVYSHNHIIHISDTGADLEIVSSLLATPNAKLLQRSHDEFFSPWFMVPPKFYAFEHVSLGSLKVKCAVTIGKCVGGQTVAITDSPHYDFVVGHTTIYEDYYNKGVASGVLTDSHTVHDFLRLKRNFKIEWFDHCKCGNDGVSRRSLIIVDENDVIRDGAHRAALALAASKSISKKLPVVKLGRSGKKVPTCASMSNKSRNHGQTKSFSISRLPAQYKSDTSQNWATITASTFVLALSESMQIVLFKLTDGFPHSMKSGNDIDILVSNITSAIFVIERVAADVHIHISRLKAGRQAHVDIHNSNMFIRLDLYEEFVYTELIGARPPSSTDVREAAVNREITPGVFILVPSLPHECELRWLEWKNTYQQRPGKFKHILWNRKHGCALKWTEPGKVQCFIEVPRNSSIKRELNGPTRLIKQPMIHNYGFIPGTVVSTTKTWEEHPGDGDPVDCIALGPTLKFADQPIIYVKGILKMIDNGRTDWKIVGSVNSDSVIPWEDLVEWFTSYKTGTYCEKLESIKDAMIFIDEVTS